MDQEPDFFADVLRIGLGVALGLVLSWAAFQYYSRYVASQAIAVVESATPRVLAQSSKAEVQRRAVERLNAEQARLAAERRAARIAEQRRQENAWNAFYQPSPECLTSTSVECGNTHIRARRAFEESYKPAN